MSLNGSAHNRKVIVVRFANDTISDLPLDITNVDSSIITTSWLRKMCRQLRPAETNGKRLRFIQNGRPLNSHSNLGIENFKENPSINEMYVHGIIGAKLTPEELANEDNLDENFSNTNENGTTQAIGFDRLRSVGFSEQEIDLLRQQFLATYGDLEAVPDRQNQDIRQLEEQWMETGANDPQGQQFNSIGIANWKSNMDLLIGLSIGSLLGVFSILLLKQEGLFSQRQKMSIIAGLIFNIAMWVRAF
ncbi:uncharacterized membrane protein YOR223W [Kluyveromyces marxianus]|uniref:Uncharacterized membrane protein YOR223W n=2 Tax=Kluyveromyces marxianus TaxID=4911 RepID=W0T6K3_KLUMD|nr:uncharacterized protein KLMA_20794 [Kluyveromyces marxianus DMKU3-1042]QGN14973.1 putative membrane protein YOR223W [Kluyveromyces marxianus]BAO39252.1 uncharacterized membrane protein YOR223W [Kluyveromyces marxianus DMKU3-1042]BAP70763.1 uncharacterized membrane protein YOR223W [Kluyveromyces marxianus]